MNNLPSELIYEIYTYLITQCDICNQTFYTWHMVKVCFSTRYFFNEDNDREIYRCIRCYLNNRKNTYYIVFLLIYCFFN